MSDDPRKLSDADKWMLLLSVLIGMLLHLVGFFAGFLVSTLLRL